MGGIKYFDIPGVPTFAVFEPLVTFRAEARFITKARNAAMNGRSSTPCHPERSGCFAERSSCGVEGPLHSEH